MSYLSDILNDLGDTDRTLQELKALAAERSDDGVFRTNISAISKRRRDLERRLDSTLSAGQLDLIQLRVEREDGSIPAAHIVARAVILFQAIVSGVFGAVRTETRPLAPPSPDIEALSSLTFATSPNQADVVSLSIPNDRLLAIRSDLDVTLDLVFSLFELRTVGALKSLAQRTGLSPITKLYEWVSMNADDGYRTSIGWRKSRERTVMATISPSQAVAMKDMIGSTYDSESNTVDMDGLLVGLDEVHRTFHFETVDGANIQGRLVDAFPRGQTWVMNTRLTASLTRTSQVDYGTGSQTVQWALTALLLPDQTSYEFEPD